MEIVMSINEEKYESLKLGKQLCFPLYACSKEIIRKYKPYLDDIDLTYTQYITMMVLWEKNTVNVKTLGECLYLDSGTLTPVLKKLESKGYITRVRSSEDERNLVVSITDEGMALRDKALSIPDAMGSCVQLTAEEAGVLYKLLYKIIGNVR
jgi:DNA-binding MarR family transcriptional regulator